MLSLVLAGNRLVRGLRLGNSHKSYFLVASFTAPRVLHIDPNETQKLEDSRFSLAFAFIVRQFNSGNSRSQSDPHCPDMDPLVLANQ